MTKTEDDAAYEAFKKEYAADRAEGLKNYTESDEYGEMIADMRNRSKAHMNGKLNEIREAYLESLRELEEVEIPLSIAFNAPSAAPKRSGILYPNKWYEERHTATDAATEDCNEYIELTSSDIRLSTLRSRIGRFLDDDEWTVERRGHRLVFSIRADMLGYLTQRLY